MRGRPEHDVHREAAALLALTTPTDTVPSAPNRPRWTGPRRPLRVVMGELAAAWVTLDQTGTEAARADVDRLRAELATSVARAQRLALVRAGVARRSGRVP